MSEFMFYCPTRIHFGETALDRLVETITAEKYTCVALVVDHNLAAHPLTADLQKKLGEKITLITQAVSVAEPTYTFLDSFRESFMDRGIEAVIGLGGGSALDTAKAVAVLITNREPAITYRGFDKMTEPVLPIYAVPTTAGTGSEITPNASFVDSVGRKKLGINGEAVRPRGAFMHPGFIVTCPAKPATYAAIDALVHSIEAFVAKKATLPAKLIAHNAISLISQNIVSSVKEKNIDAIEKVFWGSLLAAQAMMHSGAGPAAAFSYPLGVHNQVPHGLAGAVFLLHVIRWNIAKGFRGYDALSQNGEPLIDGLSRVWEELDVPPTAGDVGFRPDQLDQFLVDLRDLKGAIEQNPVPMTEADVKELLLNALPQGAVAA